MSSITTTGMTLNCVELLDAEAIKRWKGESEARPLFLALATLMMDWAREQPDKVLLCWSGEEAHS